MQDLDKTQLEFLNWVQVYNNVMANVPGADRQDAIDAMDDDVAFDQWLADYKRKLAQSGAKRAPGGGNKKMQSAPISKDEFLKHLGTVKS